MYGDNSKECSNKSKVAKGELRPTYHRSCARGPNTAIACWDAKAEHKRARRAVPSVRAQRRSEIVLASRDGHVPGLETLHEMTGRATRRRRCASSLPVAHRVPLPRSLPLPLYATTHADLVSPHAPCPGYIPSQRCRRDTAASASRREAPRAVMPPPGNADEAAALRWCDGGVGGRPPLRAPLPAGAWRPGMPTHWTEESPGARVRHLALRAVSLLQLAAGVAYLQYRARRTIGVFDTSPQLLYVRERIAPRSQGD